jgi:hypothetical protein
MRQKSIRSAYRWLAGSIDSGLVNRMSDLSTLAVWLENQLPSPLNQECRLINLRGSTLVIGASSPVWAARVRFQTSRLIAAIRRDLPFAVRKVQVKVLNAPPEQNASTKRAVRLSPNTAELLLQTARDINHPKLSAALSRLAAHIAHN